MQRREREQPPRLQQWYRALGRLHRATGMRHLRHTEENPGPSSLTPPLPEPQDIGPTDPEVYAGPSRPPRPPTPRPQPSQPEQLYDVPTPVPLTITPTSDLLREILEEIGDNPGTDVVGDVRSPPPGNTPPPSYQDLKESP